MNLIMRILATLVLLPAPAFAQSSPLLRPLSAEDIHSAIDLGVRNPGREQGIVLIDVGRVMGSIFGQLAASHGQLVPGTQVLSTGFQVTIYTPFLWLAREGSQSLRPASPDDIDPELLRPVLRVFALPSLPPDVGPNFGTDVSPVVDVTLQDGSRRIELLPTVRRPLHHNGLRGLIAEFPLDGVAALRGSRPELHVIVKGVGANKRDFTLKAKHLAELRLN